MKRPNIAVLALLMSMLAIAQVAVGQTNTPPPNTTDNVTPAGPTRAPQQKQRQQQQQQPARHQQSQQPPPQVEKQQQQPQQHEEQQLPVGPQPQEQRPEQEQERKQQHQQARRIHRSNPVPASVMNYGTALERCQRERHPHVWWTEHYAVIVFAVGGYYYFDAGYWFPALGYNPNYEAYDYDGPIYTYGNLLPDQVILNVQRALTELGYYAGALSGSLSAPTRYAISAYQQDNGLTVNGVVDAPLVYSLGLQ